MLSLKSGSYATNSIRVLYKDVCLAVFHSDNTKGDLQEAAKEYVQMYGYLAEWRYQSIKAGKIVDWSEDMRILP